MNQIRWSFTDTIKEISEYFKEQYFFSPLLTVQRATLVNGSWRSSCLVAGICAIVQLFIKDPVVQCPLF